MMGHLRHSSKATFLNFHSAQCHSVTTVSLSLLCNLILTDSLLGLIIALFALVWLPKGLIIIKKEGEVIKYCTN